MTAPDSTIATGKLDELATLLPPLQGSPLWALLIYSMVALLIINGAVRGYVTGLPRQLLGFAGLIGGMALALTASPPLATVLQPKIASVFLLPRPVLAFVLGVLLFLGCCLLAGIIGCFVPGAKTEKVVRPTRKDSRKILRKNRFPTAGTGLVLGTVNGVIWAGLLLVVINIAGTLAQASVVGHYAGYLREDRGENAGSRTLEINGMTTALGRLKASAQLGIGRKLAETLAPLSENDLRRLAKAFLILGDPQALGRLGEHPYSRRLIREDPVARICADEEITQLARRGQYLDLLKHPAVIQAADDPQVQQLLWTD